MLGMLAGGLGQADDGVLADTNQAHSLSDSTPIGQVSEDAEAFVARQPAVERGGLALGEAILAYVTVQQAVLALLAVATVDGDVAPAALAVAGAVGVLAAEALQVVHNSSSLAGWSLRATSHYGGTTCVLQNSQDTTRQ